MTPIRPVLADLAARPGGALPGVGGDARAAFFRAALGAAQSSTATAQVAPQSATPPAVRPVPIETVEAARPDPLSRPGRLLDIRV